MTGKIGLTMMATGVLHNLVGVILYSSILEGIVSSGLFNTVNEPHYDRTSAFWFLMTGVFIFMVGHLLHWFQAKIGYLPKVAGWYLLGISLVGVLVMPASGFWLVLIQALILLGATNRKDTAKVVEGTLPVAK